MIDEAITERPAAREQRNFTSPFYALKREICVFFLYGILALALLSPTSSSSVIPAIPDNLSALGHICQARLALHERVLPLRVAPWEFEGRGYPAFQFYGQVPFTVAGILYACLTPDNPFMTMLLMEWCALALSGFFMYKSCLLLTRSIPASLIAGALYAGSPYFLINIHSRGAFCEALAQGSIPAVIYYSLRCYFTPGPGCVLMSAIAWFVLLGSHLITFGCFAASFLFAAGVVFLFQLRMWRRFLAAAAGLMFGVLLSLYHLATAVLEPHLEVKAVMGSPFGSNWLTPLAALLAPWSVPPLPLPDAGLSTANLHTAAGWPLLISFLTVVWYAILNPVSEKAAWTGKIRHRRIWAVTLAITFATAFFATWSPVDFWQYLPKQLYFVQFTYRIMTQCMWTGALLSAFALLLIFRDSLGRKHVAIGMLLAGFASSSYLFSLKAWPLTVAQVVKAPSLGYGAGAYLYVTQPEDLLPDTPAMLSIEQTKSAFSRDHGKITGTIAMPPGVEYAQLPAFYFPKMLRVRVDGIESAYVDLPANNTAWVGVKLPAGSHKIEIAFAGYRWANWISLAGGVAAAGAFLFLALARARRLLSPKAVRTVKSNAECIPAPDQNLVQASAIAHK
jgi:hypothetical protein